MLCIRRESLFYGNVLRKQTDYLSGICIVFILFFDNDRQASGNCSAILLMSLNVIRTNHSVGMVIAKGRNPKRFRPLEERRKSAIYSP